MPWEHALKIKLSKIALHGTTHTEVNVTPYALKERAETSPFSYFHVSGEPTTGLSLGM